MFELNDSPNQMVSADGFQNLIMPFAKMLMVWLLIMLTAPIDTSYGADSPSTTAASRLHGLINLADDAVANIPVKLPNGPSLPPLFVLLHGAGQTPEYMISRFVEDADKVGAVLLAPKSRGVTWDIIGMERDAQMMDHIAIGAHYRYATSKDADRVMSAMAMVSSKVATDPAHQTLLGFSDGASFALALGTARNRPFTKVVALSPGILALAARTAVKRDVIIMHGRHDHAPSFEFTRSAIVPARRAENLKVRFIPFDGDHEIAMHLFDVLDGAQ